MSQICSQCALMQDDTEFRPGHRQCKTCQRVKRRMHDQNNRDAIRAYMVNYRTTHIEQIRASELAYRLAHREERRLYSQQFRAEHPEWYINWYAAHPDYDRIYNATHRVQRQEYARIYYQGNIERLAAYCRQYYAVHQEILIARAKKYHATHPEMARKHAHIRRARKMQSPRIEAITHLEIAERDHWRCHICHKLVTRRNWSLDHLVPLCANGSHTKDNVALAHRRCNSRRGQGRRIPAQLRLF